MEIWAYRGTKGVAFLAATGKSQGHFQARSDVMAEARDLSSSCPACAWPWRCRAELTKVV